MGVIDDILPADRSDAAPITAHLRGLLQELRREGAEAPRITIQLDADAWSALELQFRRPFRPHSSYKYLPLDVGVVAFERRREEQTMAAPETTAPRDRVWPMMVARGSSDRQSCCGAMTPAHTPFCEHYGAPAGTFLPQRPWSAAEVEARGAALAMEAASISVNGGDGPRPSDAIYTAPMAQPISEGDVCVDVAGYGGPWKEPKP